MVEVLESRSVPTITANPDFATVTAGVSSQGNVLANDVDSMNQQLWVMSNSSPQHGSVSVNADGTFTYTADFSYTGQDHFIYTAYNGAETADGDVTITVNPGPGSGHPPQGWPDSYSTPLGQVLLASAPGVLANDSDPDGDPLTVTGTYAGPYHGQVIVSADGSFEYAPNTGFSGTDSFSYMLSDGSNPNGPILVTITVGGGSGGNHPPQGSADSYSVNAGQTLNIGAPGVLGNDTDADGNALTAALASGASHGMVSLNSNGSFSYTPNTGFSGTDSFAYTVSDGQAGDGPITVTITVNGSPTNHPPVATNDSYDVLHDRTLAVSAPSGLRSNDADPDGDQFWVYKINDYIINVGTGNSITLAHGTVNVNPDGSFSYHPNLQFVGIDSFTYVVTDGMLDSAPATVTIDVTNAAPLPKQTTVYIAADNHIYHDMDFFANVEDPDGDQLMVTLVDAPTLGYLSPNLSVGSYSTFGTYNYYGVTNGHDSFVIQYSDGISVSAPVTVKVLVYDDSVDLTDPIIQTFEAVAAGPLDNRAFEGTPPDPLAVKQGQINDCWFVAAAISLAASRPDEIVAMIHVDPDYHVTTPGRPQVSFASPSLDVLPAGKSWSRIGAGGATDPEWIAVLEKAFGSNRPLIGPGGLPTGTMEPFEYMDHFGLPRAGIGALTGHSCDADWFWCTFNSTTRGKLTNALLDNKVVTAATGPSPGEGLVNMHVYSVLAYDPVNDLVTLRNPHGTEPNRVMPLADFTSKFFSIAYED